jgi:hypothetical protein
MHSDPAEDEEDSSQDWKQTLYLSQPEAKFFVSLSKRKCNALSNSILKFVSPVCAVSFSPFKATPERFAHIPCANNVDPQGSE